MKKGDRIFIDKNVNIKSEDIDGYNVNIFENTTIGKNVIIERCVTIGMNCKIGDDVIIRQFTKIGNNVTIWKGVELESHSIIDDDVKLRSTKKIIGSKENITYLGNGNLKIGCMINTIEWWLENYHSVGIDKEYTVEQIAEYFQYIKDMNE